MPAQLTSLFGRLKAAIAHFTIAQRTIVIIGVAAVVLGAVALSSYLAKPQMSPLFADLSAADASAIVDQLNADGVAYELTDGGNTILVPNDQIYAERLKVAAAGLPASTDGAGYSLLDDMGMTASEFQQTTTYRRAMEGELARTIGAMTGVKAASVKLAMPEETVFVADTVAPTASVFVETSRGVSLDAEQVQAIVHLVSAGVTGMTPTDVSVVDSEGRVLSAVGGSPAGGLADQQTATYDARVAASVQAMLDRVVGVGKAVVTVNAELNLDNSDVTSETFSAAEGVPALSSATTTETYTGTGSGAATGVLGPNNIAVPSGTEDAGSYTKGSENLNPAVNKVTETTTTTPGSVRRQSVSVVVDQQAGAALNMTDITTMVTAAAGIDATRGDTVSVSRMAFDTTSAAAAQEALAADATDAKAAAQASLIREGAIAAGVLLLLAIMFIAAKRKSRKDRREALDLGELQLVNETPLLPFGGLEALGLPAAPVPEVDEGAIKRAEISELAEAQPAEVAELLRGWLVGGAAR
ncbi:flagellar basal-body MS-ring/collar protein FliF [Pengzhenrongella sicca]|uniref:Flagellar M-ring protein n=1 Tax=Pengzhenrongella sicca TaxID=2819238 RepID=A0A8A4ZD17_9MICO|nr:flagellar basal-body MS-ring/collar protein FliF [Pengzhenrongella sicca]QTE29870.1 flagellar M-ring protein FliF [Pengzhenrongella sicca]